MAAGLNVGGFTDWRLPTTLQLDATCSNSNDAGSPYGVQSYAYGCTGSELGHLFYQEIAAAEGSSILTGKTMELDKFTTIQDYIYWSGTEYAPLPVKAWYFYTSSGYQGINPKDSNLYAWAVRSGDVVPEPGIIGLLGIGALAWAGTRQKRRD